MDADGGLIRDRPKPPSRTSPSADRIVALLTFFIEHSQQAFTATQVAKSLRLSRATVQSILLGFVEAGYLYRRTDKTYLLGRALHLLSATATQPVSAVDVASQEMRDLADELDVIAAALFVDGQELVVRERAASVSHLGWLSLSSPRRYPLAPWGAAFLASQPDARIAARLEQVAPPLSEEMKAMAMVGVGFARRHGYSVVLVPEGEDVLGDRPRPSGLFVADLQPQTSYPLRSLVAPVMDVTGDVAFGLALFGFRTAMTGEAIFSAGRRLRDAGHRITAFTAGRRPELPL